MTNSLLPVLQQDHPLMSLCSVCPKPGMCCRNFPLFNTKSKEEVTFWEATWREDAKKFLLEMGLPFEPVAVRSTYETEDKLKYITALYSCPKVTVDGRCSIYQDRPQLCRKYLPGNSDICCFYKGEENDL